MAGRVTRVEFTAWKLMQTALVKLCVRQCNADALMLSDLEKKEKANRLINQLHKGLTLVRGGCTSFNRRCAPDEASVASIDET